MRMRHQLVHAMMIDRMEMNIGSQTPATGARIAMKCAMRVYVLLDRCSAKRAW